MVLEDRLKEAARMWRRRDVKFAVVFAAIWIPISALLSISVPDGWLIFGLALAMPILALGVPYALVCLIRSLLRRLGWISPPAPTIGTTLREDFIAFGKGLVTAVNGIATAVAGLIALAIYLALVFGALVLLFKIVRWAWALSS